MQTLKMIFYPKSYFKSILDVKLEFLKQKNIKAILIDIDNTILGSDGNTIEGLEKWAEDMKNNNIKLCILSNTNRKKKAQKMSELLNIPYIYFAIKPFKFNFLKAKKILQMEQNEQIAVIGDQVLTDILGANRCEMYSILVKPLHEKDIFVTRLNRIIERKILKRYFDENKNESESKVN